MARMISTTVYLTQDQLRRLKAITQRTGIPQAVVIRRGVEIALKDMANKGDT